MIRLYAACSAIVVLALAADVARADSIAIQAGDYVRLTDGPGSSPGGEFISTKQVFNGSAWVDGTTTWSTFCLETNEYFSYNELLRVASVTTGATNGGTGGQSLPNFDPISNETAWLYTQMQTGALVGLNGAGTAASGGYLSNQASNATYLQKAIWYLEGESLGSTNYYVTLAQAAVGAGWTNGSGFVKVMNLERWDSTNRVWVKAQDQLVYSVPEPASLALLGLGLAAAGAMQRRRRGRTAA